MEVKRAQTALIVRLLISLVTLKPTMLCNNYFSLVVGVGPHRIGPIRASVAEVSLGASLATIKWRRRG
jgi:hypothetical protein